MRAFVLTYHSHNIAGDTYAANDHVALATDLRLLAELGARFVSLAEVVDALERGDVADRRLAVALTFDDGPVFDFEDFVHPRFGPQRGFLGILQDFRKESGAPATATSFVIASPEARRAMERADECGFTYLEDWLRDDWWPAAARTGVLDIGNHSWDHVHSAPGSIATKAQVRNDFTQVADRDDADREIRAASDYIESRVGRACPMFAFPFGHVNEYLLHDYLPHHGAEHRLRAAFGTGGRPVRPEDSRWNIPRAVCGYHWRAPEDLRALLA